MKRFLAFAFLCFLYGCLVALAGGCTSFREYYPDGKLKADYRSFGQNKTVNEVQYGDLKVKGYKSDSAAAIDLANKLADKIP